MTRVEPWKPGDTGWLVPRGSYSGVPPGREIIVTRVGRAWVYYSEPGRRRATASRFSVADGYIDNGKYISPGRVWRSQEEYERHAGADRAWADLCRRMGPTTRPEGVTVAQIHEAARLLGIKLEGME